MSEIKGTDIIICEEPDVPVEITIRGDKLYAQVIPDRFAELRGKVFIIMGTAASAQEGMIMKPDELGRFHIPLPITQTGRPLWRLRVRDPRKGETGW